jgi:hypothetical protein
MTSDEMVDKLKEEVKGLTRYLSYPVDYNNACDDASRDTGFSFPVTTSFKIYWMKQRAKRHLFFYLQSESAHKFKFEQINLQHRFEHYSKIIKDMDLAFEEAKKSNPAEFAGIDTFKQFGTVAGTGFAYEPLTGRNITHDPDQQVVFNPTDGD